MGSAAPVAMPALEPVDARRARKGAVAAADSRNETSVPFGPRRTPLVLQQALCPASP